MPLFLQIHVRTHTGEKPYQCSKADIDLDKRAGECTEEEVEKIITIMSNPRQYKIPDWFLNRQKDIVDGKYSQLTSSNLDSKLREDLERLKKIRAHRVYGCGKMVLIFTQSFVWSQINIIKGHARINRQIKKIKENLQTNNNKKQMSQTNTKLDKEREELLSEIQNYSIQLEASDRDINQLKAQIDYLQFKLTQTTLKYERETHEYILLLVNNDGNLL
ncbi:unnamed protein product [Leptidea sinapis]|uniref:Small ribosomal subunit protein uS13 n=1 Tax=Leptidea sinapis TaxID=189913 RepID=A0A5E4QDF5_9NEOP|nr:unnamed protein product [Leptidea sinapis]